VTHGSRLEGVASGSATLPGRTLFNARTGRCRNFANLARVVIWWGFSV
jgi:hypothetical protein